MANSMTQTYSPSTINDTTFANENSINISKNDIDINNNNVLAPSYKYQLNCSRSDIEKTRKLLTTERASQSHDEQKFWTPDYDRMMKDDWLVTRFLLRGIKAAGKKQGNIPSSVHDQTMALIKACANFRRDFFITPETKEDEFPDDWVRLNGIFNYKPDLMGNPTMYLRIKLHKPKLIQSKELRHQFKRLLLHKLELCDQALLNNPGKAICCVFDMTEATLENIDLELITWMIKSFKSSSPKLICYTLVYNLPWLFGATFKLITSTLLSNRNKQAFKFVYGNQILQYIDYNNLPNYMR